MMSRHLFPRRSILSVVLASATAFAGVSPALSAHAATTVEPDAVDEVRLPSGGFVRGEIQEFVPGEYIVLRKYDGSMQRFEWSQITSVKKADGTVVQAAQATDPFPGEGGEAQPAEGEPAPIEDEPAPIEGGTEAYAPAEDYEAAPGMGQEIGPLPENTGPVDTMIDSDYITIEAEGDDIALYKESDPNNPLCEAPCKKIVPRVPESLYLASNGKRIGQTFRIAGSSSSYKITTSRGSPARFWAGVGLIPAALAIGIGIAIIPQRHNVPQPRVAGYVAGGTIIALAGVGGAVPLLLFGRKGIQVLPVARRSRRARMAQRSGRRTEQGRL